MVKPLRKRHLQIWIMLAVLLPAGIIMAGLAVPQPVKNKLLQPGPKEALPIMLKSLQLTNLVVAVRTSADGAALQLEWISTTELLYPSSIIYQVSDSVSTIEEGNIIGRIDMRGAYHFPLKKNAAAKDFHFVVYDIIHHKVIQRINL